MAVKTYEMPMLGYENTLPVMVGEKKEYISFKKATKEDGEGYLHTDRRDLQKAIETSEKFKNGEIKLINTIGKEDSGYEDESGEIAIREDVTDFQTAREILLGEPYNLTPQSVAKNPEAILKAAVRVGVSFPGLKIIE